MTDIGKVIDFFEKKKRKAHPCDIAAYDTALAALRTKKSREEHMPLTMEELREMDGQPVWLDNGAAAGPKRWRCFIVNNMYVIDGRVCPCGIDMWGAGTSLSLLAECDLYRKPLDADSDSE